MPKDALKAWQGSYTTRMPLRDIMKPPDEVVLDIKGESAKGFDGTTEYPLGFSIVAPCIATFDQAVTGEMVTHSKQFVIEDGELIAGRGGVGMRKGRTAIVCAYGVDKLVTLDDKGVCRTWDWTAGWKSKPIECAWGKTQRGQDQLIVDGIEYVAEGDRLMDIGFNKQLQWNWHERHPSYDAAKQALDAHKRKNATP